MRHDGEFHRVADPLRRPVDGVLTLLPSNAVGSPLDKVRVGVARALTLLEEPYALLRKPETSIMQRVRSMGFSEAMIDRFFRPFFGGIFFDRELGTTSRLFDWVFRMLATGENCLPEEGIGAVPDQLVADLPEGAVRLNTRVQSVDAERRVVTLADGSEVAAPAGIVVAIEGPRRAHCWARSWRQRLPMRRRAWARRASTSAAPSRLRHWKAKSLYSF